MYGNSYSRATFGMDAKNLHKSKGKSCGYYTRIVFFFSSLIQSLIIVSLVLFLVYGQPERAAQEKHVQEQEQTILKLTGENAGLRKERGELAGSLARGAAEKKALEKEVLKVRAEANGTLASLRRQEQRTSQCEMDKRKLEMNRITSSQCPSPPRTPLLNSQTGEIKILNDLNKQQALMLQLVESNFTKTVKELGMELDSVTKARDAHHVETIALKRDKSSLEEQLTTYTKKCKEEFVKSLAGIQTVTKAFLEKIENLFPHAHTFHLTCAKQQEQIEKIRSSCTSLSKDVEDTFQNYLNKVGDDVSSVQKENSRLLAQNGQLTRDFQHCSQNSTLASAESLRQLQEAQQRHDRQAEQLLKEQSRLREEKELQEKQLAALLAKCNTKAR